MINSFQVHPSILLGGSRQIAMILTNSCLKEHIYGYQKIFLFDFFGLGCYGETLAFITLHISLFVRQSDVFKHAYFSSNLIQMSSIH